MLSVKGQSVGELGWSVAVSGTIVVVGAPFENASGILGAGHAYAFNAKTGALEKTFTSPNKQADGAFGWYVAISGSTIVVGAPFENASGILGAGHAYAFNAKTGKLISSLTSPNVQAGGYFGYSVAINGGTIEIGAPNENVSGILEAGRAYTFSVTTGKLIKGLTSPNPQDPGYFGGSVALTGNTIVIGAPYESVFGYDYAGRAYAFNAKTGTLITTFTSPNSYYDGYFGYSVAISGTAVAVGAPLENASGTFDAGNAYTFNSKTGALIKTLTSPSPQGNREGNFGTSVGISGSTVVVGAPQQTLSENGSAFTYNSKTGALTGTLVSLKTENFGNFGWSVAISGSTIAVGAPYETPGGNAYVF
jgi:hypothetical protein